MHQHRSFRLFVFARYGTLYSNINKTAYLLSQGNTLFNGIVLAYFIVWLDRVARSFSTHS